MMTREERAEYRRLNSGECRGCDCDVFTPTERERRLLDHADEADKVIERLTMALTKQRDACRDYQTMANPAWTCTRCTIPCDMQSALAAGRKP